jgi:hypothetical protein
MSAVRQKWSRYALALMSRLEPADKGQLRNPARLHGLHACDAER